MLTIKDLLKFKPSEPKHNYIIDPNRKRYIGDPVEVYECNPPCNDCEELCSNHQETSCEYALEPTGTCANDPHDISDDIKCDYKIIYVSGLPGPRGIDGPTGPQGPENINGTFISRFKSSGITNPPAGYVKFSTSNFWTIPANLGSSIYENFGGDSAHPDLLSSDATLVLNYIGGIYEICIEYEMVSQGVHSDAASDIKLFTSTDVELIGRDPYAIITTPSNSNVITDVKKWFFKNPYVGTKLVPKYLYAKKDTVYPPTFSGISETVSFSGFITIKYYM